jgi:phosphatidate cytidylyltransferase
MLKQRLITSAIGLPLLVLAIWFNTPVPWFTLLAVIWVSVAVAEFYRLVGATGIRTLTAFGIVLSVALIVIREPTVISFISPNVDVTSVLPLAITGLLVLSLLYLLTRRKHDGAFAGWSWTVTGILYIAWLFGFLVALRGLEDGRDWVFFAMFTTFASDSAAYFIGRFLGRHKLAPDISPGKTWEGWVAGVCGSVLAALFFTLPTPVSVQLNWWQAAGLGAAVSIFGQAGDLVESLFKRNVKAKDSGNVLPGHGGALDRMDSIVFAGLVVYYYVVWLVR